MDSLPPPNGRPHQHINNTNTGAHRGGLNGSGSATESVDDQNLPGASGPEILGIVWGLVFISACFLAARIYIKKRHEKGLWWDDHLLVASWTMLSLFAAATTYCVTVGLGSHAHSGAVQQSPLQLSVIIATVFSVLGAAWSKTSFALTLLRITREGSRFLYWAIWCVVVTMNVVLTFNAVLQFIWCKPVQGAWAMNMDADCWDREVVVRYTEFAAYYSAGMDFVLAAVPVAVISRLSMQLKEKAGVIVCMSLGFIAGAMSIMRAVSVPALSGIDYSYQAGLLFIWTGTELASTIVAASIPILRVLISELKNSRYPGVTELNTFKQMGDVGGIHVTKETIVSRSVSKHDRGAKFDSEDDLLTPLTPVTPVPTYHTYVKA